MDIYGYYGYLRIITHGRRQIDLIYLTILTRLFVGRINASSSSTVSDRKVNQVNLACGFKIFTDIYGYLRILKLSGVVHFGKLRQKWAIPADFNGCFVLVVSV